METILDSNAGSSEARGSMADGRSATFNGSPSNKGDTAKTIEVQIIEKHPLFIRWTHWVNFPILSLMIWSGILIYWANDIYRPFFPQSIYEALGIHHRLAQGMAMHFFVMWIFAINGSLYVAYLIFSGEWRELAPTLKSFREAALVTLHDLGLRKELPPQGKFNAAQKIAYSGVVMMGVGSLVSGLAIYKPVQLHRLAELLGGYESARLIHFVLTLGYVGFFIIHVAQVVRAGWNNFRAMVAGFEVKGDK